MEMSIMLFRGARCAFPILLRFVGNSILHCIDYGANYLINESAAMMFIGGWWGVDLTAVSLLVGC